MSNAVVNSGDSHVLEPDDLWIDNLPGEFRARAPRRAIEGEYEVNYLDGEIVRRNQAHLVEGTRPPGAYDPALRLDDLDREGIWAELMFPSRGMWNFQLRDRDLQRACAEVYNDWLLATFMERSPRFIGAAMLPVLEPDDTVRELQRTCALGFSAMFLPTTPPEGLEYNEPEWEPLWAAAAEAS